MERPGWIAPLYGYAVCLVCVVTILVNTASLVDAVVDRSNPLQGRDAMSPMGGSLTSFEAFRATYNDGGPRRVTGTDGSAAIPDTLSTAELRSRYEALRTDRIAKVSFESMKNILKSSLLLLLSVGLFVFHWRWVRAQRAGE